MFLNKTASRQPRVLHDDDCPSDGHLHYVEHYPKYYDPIYYPDLYLDLFETSTSCSSWLQIDLNSHLDSCERCQSLNVKTQIDVIWVAPSFQISSGSFLFHLSLFDLEHSQYKRCFVLDNLYCSNSDQDLKNLKNQNPLWLMSTQKHYHEILLSMTAPILLDGSIRCHSRNKNFLTERKKECYITNILYDFMAQRSLLLSIANDELQAWSTCFINKGVNDRHEAFACYMQILYGSDIGSALQILPYEIKSPPNFVTLTKYWKENTWVNESLQTLITRVERAFNFTTLLSLVKKIPAYRRPCYDLHSRRKTANNLVFHMQCRTSYLSSLDPVHLYEILLSIYPDFHSFQSQHGTILHLLLDHEYSHEIVDAITTTLIEHQQIRRNKRNTNKKNVRKIQKQKKISQSKEDVVKLKSEWPIMVSDEQIFYCLDAYRKGTVWKTPDICAVCSQYSNNIKCVTIDEYSKINDFNDLDVLRVQDEFILRQCVAACEPDEFNFQNSKLDGLMLDKGGVRTISLTSAAVLICDECQTSLTKSKIPRFSLANKLYRGKLPVQFEDLTWVEEMVCAIYRNTAHITRLYGSSDLTQPTILHGNTCAHDMNVVSTATVLPRTPTDINGMLSVVFIGPGKLNFASLQNMFRVRKQKIWNFLMWLKSHNQLYMHIEFDEAIMDLYPEDDILPYLEDKTIYNHDLDPQNIFEEETAGFSNHPASEFCMKDSKDPPSNLSDGKKDDHHEVMIEKMGVSDPESEKISGRSFTATALRHLVKNFKNDSEVPDLAVRHGISPIDEYNNPRLFPGMFPSLFPFGIGGFDDKTRVTPLSFQQQAQYYFNISDRSFRYHFSYLFVALNIWQRRICHLHTSITVKSSKFNSIAHKLTQVSSVTLNNLSKKLELEKKCHEFSVEEKNAFELLNQTNVVASRMPGSQASKIHIRNEIRTYFGCFGLPHIYFTFNPSAAHSPIFQVMFGDSNVDLSARFPQMVCSRERALRLAKDPVAAADFFEFCVRATFQHLFGWNYEKKTTQENGGILGKLRAFYGTCELTERGSFHGHFLIWLLGGMNPTDLHKKLRADIAYQKQFFKFFESIIHHHLPDVEVEIDPTFEPRIQRPPVPPKKGQQSPIQILNEWREVYATEVKMCGEILQRHVCRAVCHKYGNDGKCRFLFPHEIVEASFFDSDTNSVVLVCRDSTINYFNPYILIFCRHNHDIKCILSGKGAKAAMFYITDYITKMDLKTYQSLTLLSRAVSRMPDLSRVSPIDAAKTLLHKCLSQFTRQQQIHGQQAVRYLRGFGDGISSHQTVPMLSTLLLSFVRQHYDPIDTHEYMDSINDEDDEIESPPLRIELDHNGKLVESHQIHHYWYRSDTLADLSFYDFCRCFSLEPKKKSEQNKNTCDDRAGILRRHALKTPHPLANTHFLLEHTNEERGELRSEILPKVIGMPIPRDSSPNWYIFALAHFKPFSVSTRLRNEDDWKTEYDTFNFKSNHVEIMTNWNAIHECEDERDADRLQKREKSTAESKAMTAAILNYDIEEDINFNNNIVHDRHGERDFHLQQFISLLQQANWLNSKAQNTTIESGHDQQTSMKQNLKKNNMVPIVVDPAIATNMIKKWSKEIKFQESVICNNRRNACDPVSQSVVEIDKDTPLVTSDFGMTDLPLKTEPKTILKQNTKLGTISTLSLLENVCTKFSLNEKQFLAFKIVANNFIDRCVHNVDGIKPLHMLMTGPGGTGKTHVVKAVREVMSYFGSAHKIRFLAPTGSAASLIDGMTIHKGLGIKIVNNDCHGKSGRILGESREDSSITVSIQNKTMIRDEWQHVEIALIDECSMLSEQLLCEVDQALRFAKERPNDWFGGIIMIFAGDFYQFPPVMGTSLCKPISLYGKQTEDEFKKRLGRTAWKTIDTVIELNEQHRMKSDPEYANAILRLRTRDCTIDDIDLFNSRLIKSCSHPEGVDMSNLENLNATAIVHTNIVREVLNMSKARSNCHNTNSELIMCAANDKINSSCSTVLSHTEYTKLLHLDFSSSKYQRALPGFIPLYVGMPVILRTRNISTDLKITNGSQGYVRQIITETLPQNFIHAICVLVEFSDSPLKLTGLPKGYIPITPSTFSFTTNVSIENNENSSSNTLKVQLTRHQLPIQPAFAVTGHSAQGKTLPKILASLHEGGFGAYVAASRPSNRQGLCITHPVQLKDLMKPLGHDLFFENLRLKALEHNTYIKYGFASGVRMDVPDPETETDLDLNLTSTVIEPHQKKRKLENISSDTVYHTDIPIETTYLSPLKKFKNDTSNYISKQPTKTRQKESIPLAIETKLPHPNSSGSSQISFQSGCQWSSTNYSCAYDVAFMSLYFIYNCQNLQNQRMIQDELNTYDMLGDSLHSISHSRLQPTSQFDFFRDKLRDYLSTTHPNEFPRYGHQGASAALIFETIFPHNTRRTEIYGDCQNGCEYTSLAIQKNLPTIMCAFDDQHYKEPASDKITLFEHLKLVMDDINLHRLNTVQFCQCGSPFLKFTSLLHTTPRILYFELENNISFKKILPSLIIEIPTIMGNVEYKIASIIYLGEFHFTCRFLMNKDIWTYDGRISQGCPIIDPIDFTTNLDSLLTLDGRAASICIYVLNDDAIPVTT